MRICAAVENVSEIDLNEVIKKVKNTSKIDLNEATEKVKLI
jgi:hypothetical protein